MSLRMPILMDETAKVNTNEPPAIAKVFVALWGRPVAGPVGPGPRPASRLCRAAVSGAMFGSMIEAAEPPAPEVIQDLARSCRNYVRKAVGVELDFTRDTLPLLDHYVATVRPEVQEREELRRLVAHAVGAYFGEVVRRTIGGFWRMPSANVHDWAVCARPVFLSINPMAVAYDALAGGQEHDGPRSDLSVAPEYRAAIAERLAALPPVPEDEFYLLSTRLEAIEVAVEALRASMSATGYEDQEFDESDYAAEVILN